jgi:hypothetical protein
MNSSRPKFEDAPQVHAGNPERYRKVAMDSAATAADAVRLRPWTTSLSAYRRRAKLLAFAQEGGTEINSRRGSWPDPASS